MKMTEENYKRLRSATVRVIALNGGPVEVANRYKDASNVVILWDLYHATGLNMYSDQPGLNDSHIETAMRKIVADLGWS